MSTSEVLVVSVYCSTGLIVCSTGFSTLSAGFFDFIADAGSSLFKGNEPEPEITKPIAIHIKDAGVVIDNLKVDFKSGAVTLSGYLPNL